MSSLDLTAAFRQLRRPCGDSDVPVFSTLAIGAMPHRIGKDKNGAPALLVSVGTSGHPTAPIVLQHLSVLHEVGCRVTDAANGGVTIEARFTLIRCLAAEGTLRQYFVRVCELAVTQLGDCPSGAQVNVVIRRLLELFQAFEAPPTRTIQGLWAELATIAWAEMPEVLLRAWHIDPVEAFDFSDGEERLEVKSFSGSVRMHSFSLAQVRPTNGVRVVVVSIKAERNTGGVSIDDLLAIVRSRVPADLAAKAELVVARSLGNNAALGLSICFDMQCARASLRFYAATDVPAIDPLLPAGVFRVRFDAILDEGLALSPVALRNLGALGSGATPASRDVSS